MEEGNLMNKVQKMERKRHFSYRFKLLSVIGALFVVLLFTLMSPVFTQQTYSKVDVAKSIPFGQNTALSVTERSYNPKSHLYRQVVTIDSASQSVSATDDNIQLLDNGTAKDLANLSYSVKTKIQRDDSSELKTKLVRVNDQMLVIYTHGVPNDYTAIRFELKVSKRNSLLKSDVINSGRSITERFYATKSVTKKNESLQEQSKVALNRNYSQTHVSEYEKVIRQLKTSNEAAEADIKQNNVMADKLTDQLKDQAKQDRDTIQKQIDDLKNTNTVDRQTITTNKEKISLYKQRIDAIKDLED